jgi:3-oxoacyl-[acyl-carrier-protein] synthase II
MRIAVTGLGVVSPAALGEEELAEALASGRSGIAPAGAPPEGQPQLLTLAARVPADFGQRREITANAIRRMPRLTQMTVVAAKQALRAAVGGDAQAALPYAAERTGVVLGTGLGTLGETLDFVLGYLKDGVEAASPTVFPVSVMNAPAGQLAVELKLKGVNTTVNHRDHSPLSAVGMACDLLELGRADALLVGGIDELSYPVEHVMVKLGRVSSTALRPYDVARDGLVPGEAATVLLLEREEDARRRGARVRAVIVGRGETSEARPRVGWGHAPRWPEAERAVAQALAVGDPARISWIAGAGNGTVLDQHELATLRAAFAAAGAPMAPISSITGQSGDSFSTGMLRIAAAVVGIDRGLMPGTVGLERPIAGFEDVVVKRARRTTLDRVLVPSFAQGGANLALVVSAPN